MRSALFHIRVFLLSYLSCATILTDESRYALTTRSIPVATALSSSNRNISNSNSSRDTMEAHNILKFRAVTTQMSTCGYYDGDPSKVRTADPGYNCRVDISRGLWGFCPTTVISANDCGMAGACVDEGTCSSVCGFSGAAATTFSW